MGIFSQLRNNNDKYLTPWKSRSLREKVTSVIPLLISLLVLAALLTFFRGYDLLAQVNLPLLFLALAISFAINGFLGTHKWRTVISLSGIHTGFWELWRIWVGLFPMTFFMPFQTGHALYAVALKKAKRLNWVQALETVGYDKYLSLVGTFCLIALGQSVIDPDHVLANDWILLGSLGVLVFYLLDDYALRLMSKFAFFRERSKLVHRQCGLGKKLYLLALGTLYQSSDLISFYLACRCLGIEVAPLALLGVFPVILLLTYVPITFSGIGAREGLIVLFMSVYLNYDQALAAGLLVDFLEYLAPSLIGLLCLRHLLRIFAMRSEPEEPSVDTQA